LWNLLDVFVLALCILSLIVYFFDEEGLRLPGDGRSQKDMERQDTLVKTVNAVVLGVRYIAQVTTSNHNWSDV
jgi:hypothetical protein